MGNENSRIIDKNRQVCYNGARTKNYEETKMVFKVYLTVCAVISAIAFVLFGIDKRKAKKEKGRFPEIALLTLSSLGGGIGALAGMLLFRHKISFFRKWYFVIGVPFCALTQLVFAAVFAWQFFVPMM